ncbi:Hypothetical predicted protein [Podarcis lilfordi]|uniref:Uncharacterized protein n=1 Tax=Podarcis lilfordi TaxID=74358 RepID=A0AA35LBF5_9SAUR|nr:Hypothetical predicted protein [Podarcis lilfordi]
MAAGIAVALGIYIGIGGWPLLWIIFKTALRDLLMAFFLKKKEKKIYPDEEDPAGSMLPALVKPSQSAAEARRKTQAPPVVLPGLVQPQTSTLHPVSSRQDSRQQRPLSLAQKEEPRGLWASVPRTLR